MSGAGPDDGAILARAREVALFAGLLEDLKAGRGRCALIEGEHGIGKSTVLEALLSRAGVAGFAVARGAFHESGPGHPVQALTEALGLGTADEPRRAPSGASGPVDPVATAVERVLSEVERRCSNRPLVLAADDLHRADESSLLLWQRLCRTSSAYPLLLVATCLPGSDRPQLERLRRVVRSQGGAIFTLPEFGPAAVLELVERVLGATAGPRLAQRLECAGGNPLYVREMLQALTRAGAVALESGIAELIDAPDEHAAPASTAASQYSDPLTAVIGARLDLLSESATELLRLAALLGPEFAVTDLSAMLGRSAGALTTPVQEAIAAGVLEPRGSRLRFRYRLLHQGLLESVPAPVRARLYRAAVKALMDGGAPIERVAELVLSADTPRAWEGRWAARHAESLRRKAPQVAFSLFEHLLTRGAAAGGDRDVLTDELAKAAFTLGRYERSAALCRDILNATDDPSHRGAAAWILACSLAWTGRLSDADAVIASALLESRTTALWRARLNSCAAMTAVSAGRYDEARDAASCARAEGERLGDGIAIGYALFAEASLLFLDSDLQGCLEAVAQALNSLEIEPELTDLRLRLYSVQMAALTELDRFGEAELVVRAARALGRRADQQRPRRPLLAGAQLAYHQGHWDDALQALDESSLRARGGRDAVLARDIRALITARREEGDDAVRDPAGLAENVSPGRLDSGYAVLAEAVAYERRDRPAEALTTLARVLTSAYDGLEGRVLLLPALVRLAVERGDASLAEAGTRFAAEHASSRAPGCAAMIAQWCRGLFTEDRAALAEVAEYLRSVGRKPELGRALEDVVVLSSMAGQADSVRNELAEALAVYADLGAVWDVRRITGRLRPYGVRVSSPGAIRPRTGWAALTNTEHRIALLVAAGQSNPEIAAALSLSRRTVETHVSRVLAKLGVRSRREVAGVPREEASGREQARPDR